MIIREYMPSDCPQIVQLFYNTVHAICRNDYNESQLCAWARAIPNVQQWNKELISHYTIVAEYNGIITGFGDINNDYLDRLYVHKDYQKHGIGAKIVTKLENYARDNGATNITTHASITAKPFFQRLGYKVQSPQQVVRHNVSLTNYIMLKCIK